MLFEYLAIPHHKQLLAGTCERNVQFPVNGCLVVQVAQEVQLIRFVHAERNNDNIALAALKTLYRIHHDIFIRCNVCFHKFVLDECDLIPVRYNDPDIPCVKIPLIVRINLRNGSYDLHHDLRFIVICFR